MDGIKEELSEPQEFDVVNIKQEVDDGSLTDGIRSVYDVKVEIKMEHENIQRNDMLCSNSLDKGDNIQVSQLSSNSNMENVTQNQNSMCTYPVSINYYEKYQSDSTEKITKQNDMKCRINTGVRSYECDICKKTFKKKYHLSVHFLTHTGLHPCECDICNQDSS